ncbi:hypothetical protein AL755_17895 [Arthrobacter sp. ERGS1:01]|nr:hypothetical protein AL755_17895 [Arthrobacter sp. ERGS1:01]
MVVATLSGITFGMTFIAVVLVPATFSTAFFERRDSGPLAMSGLLPALVFVASLALLVFLATGRNRSGAFVAPTVAVAFVFLGHGVLTAMLLYWYLAFAADAGSIPAGIDVLAPIIPFLTVAVAALFSALERTGLVRWRPLAVARLPYIVPALFLLAGTAVVVLARITR